MKVPSYLVVEDSYIIILRVQGYTKSICKGGTEMERKLKRDSWVMWILKDRTSVV